jgi:YD repeat-containing protein
MSWNAPGALNVPNSPGSVIERIFEYGPNTSYGSTLAITAGTQWSVALNSLVPGSGTANYAYRISYKVDGRVVSQQTGTFSIVAGTSTVTWSTSVTTDTPPTLIDPPAPLTGSSSVLQATSTRVSTATYSSPPGGGAPGGNPPRWWGGNAILINWISTGGQNVRVVMDWDSTFQSGTHGPAGAQRSIVTNAASQVSISWSETDAGAASGGNPQASFGGVWGATRIRIYSLDAQGNNLALLRDSQSSQTVPGPVAITWAAPTDATLTYKFFYYVSGNPVERTITRSGNTLSVDLAGIGAGTYNYKIEYYRPGETSAIVNKTGTFTTDTVTVTVNSQATGNFEPSWLTVNPNGSEVLWNRPINPGESLVFEYWNGSAWVAKGYSSFDNITYRSDFAGFGAGTYSFRMRYRTIASGALQAQWSGQITVGSTTNTTNPYGSFGSQSGWNDATDIIPVTTTVTDDVFRWSFPKGSASDRVRFIYTLNGVTNTLDQSGSGPDFAVTLSALTLGANNFTWSVEYTRPWNGETNAYAAAYGSASITRNAVAPSSITVDTQQNVFPSPIPIAAPVDAGGGFFGWATAPDAGAAIEFSYTPNGGSKVTVTTGFVAYGTGRKLDLSGLAAGTYRYSIKYTHSGEPTAYAKADGVFTISKADGAPSGSATVGAAAPETLLLSGAAIQGRPLTNPPEAVWARRDWTTPPTYIPSVEAITSPGYGGGFIQDAPKSTAFPNGIYHQVSPPSAYSMYNGLVFVWTPDTALDTRITFDYRPRGSTGAFTPINVYRMIGYTQVGAEVTSLTAGDYEFRVTYTLTGSSTPFASASGIFTRTADGLNQNISIDPAVAAQSITAKPVLKQSVDRWGNTIVVQDAGANITEYRYDAHNQQVQVTAPLVDYLDTRTTFTDITTSDRPKTYNYLDKLGRQVATRDANGNLMRYYYNAAGQLVTTQNADSSDNAATGAFKRNEYDTFGQVIQTSDELTTGHTDNLGFKTRNFYDRGGRLTDVWREIFDNTMPAAGTVTPPASLQTMSYGYDENNRRIRETNGAGETTRYAYDLQGNVILRRTPGLNDTRYSYNVHGAKATEEVDVYTGNVFARQTWSTDYFGRVRGHVGWTMNNGGANTVYFGGGTGASYTYDYNMAGLLWRQQSNEGQSIVYTFDEAGQNTVISDNAVNRQTYLTYDSAGRRSRERIIVDGLIHQDTKTNYDALGRISFVEDADYRLNYSYDLAGNRTLIHDEFVNHAATRTVENLYFTYDKMNRVKLGQGIKTAVPATSPVQYQVTLSGDIGEAQGFIYTYNARGDRTSTTQHDLTWNLSGTTWTAVRSSANPNTEKYTYDGLGRLTDVERETNTGTGFTLYRHNVYDKANRVTSETNYFLENSAIANRTTVTGYDADGRASTQTTTKGGEYENIMSFGAATLSGGVWSAGYDKAGNLRGYTMKQFDHDHQNTTNPLITTENRFTYELGETFMVSYESARSSSSSVPANQLPKNGDVYREYNADEELVKARDTTTLSKSRGYVNNQQGQVLTSVQIDVTSAAQFNTAMDAAVAHAALNGQTNAVKAQYSFYFNGAMLGTVGQLQPNAQGQFKGNFDVNYTPISEEYPMSTPPTVVAQKGDTLRIIAARIYGDASLWYLLADENALTSPDDVIPEGTSLRVPNNVVSLANSANVYKPYDASKAIGDLSPSQPIPPPPKQDCNMLAMVLIIIVMVVVTIFTAGAAAVGIASMMGTTAATAAGATGVMAVGGAALGGTLAVSGVGALATAGIGIAAAAVGGAVGSAVSQGLGIALGVQEKFDWKGVAIGALSAGFGSGLGAAGAAFEGLSAFAAAHPYMYAAASAATGSAVTQGISVAAKLQDKFSWREVAITAVAAGASEVAGNYAGSRMNQTSMKAFRTGVAARGPLTNFATTIVKGYTTAGVRAAFGGKFDIVQVTADAFGNAIANEIVGAINRPPAAAERNFTPGMTIDGRVNQVAESGAFSDKALYGEEAAALLGSAMSPRERELAHASTALDLDRLESFVNRGEHSGSETAVGENGEPLEEILVQGKPWDRQGQEVLFQRFISGDKDRFQHYSRAAENVAAYRATVVYDHDIRWENYAQGQRDDAIFLDMTMPWNHAKRAIETTWNLTVKAEAGLFGGITTLFAGSDKGTDVVNWFLGAQHHFDSPLRDAAGVGFQRDAANYRAWAEPRFGDAFTTGSEVAIEGGLDAASAWGYGKMWEGFGYNARSEFSTAGAMREPVTNPLAQNPQIGRVPLYPGDPLPLPQPLSKMESEILPLGSSVENIPSRVQSRINLRNGDPGEKAGWNHVVEEHFSGKPNKSQFTISQNELRYFLQSEPVVQAPVSQVVESAIGPRYVRELDFGRPIGIDKFSGKYTSTFVVMTDRYGNLVTTYPGRIK